MANSQAASHALADENRPDAGPGIAIVGSGFSGVCLGIQLKRAGFHRFTIYEKSDRIGGTWRDNSYPGAACDVPSISYCFSFEQKVDWTRKWSPQPEILRYLEHCVDKYGLRSHVEFGTEIGSATFDDECGVWSIATVDGRTVEADVFVSGTGQLNRPAYPDIEGLNEFVGECFHSARWNHGCDMTGRTVAVVGNAASAIQFVPVIAEQAERLFVFQRSANWMLPRGDRAYSEREKRVLQRFPLLARLARWAIWASYESVWPLFKRNRWMAARTMKVATAEIEKCISDPEMRAALTPDYPVGGKRILISDDYYRTLARDDVELVTARIARIERDAVVTDDGRRRAVDAIVLATGFDSTLFLAPMDIRGARGRSLNEVWADGAEAYLGLAVSGFPNMFLMYGPNTNLGHNSIVFMIECQVRYIVDCIAKLAAEPELAYLDVLPEVQAGYNARLARELARTTWSQTGKSWYKTASGKITNNWGGSTVAYWWRTRRPDFRAFRMERRSAEARAAGRHSSKAA